MNVRREVKCGYCGKKRTLWADRGKMLAPVRMVRRLPNGLECCSTCYPPRAQERKREERERDAERRARAERRSERLLKRALMPYAVKRAA